MRAALAILLIMLASCGAGDRTAQDAGRIELQGVGRLPPSARNIQLSMARDTLVRIRFDAPLGDALSFANRFAGPLTREAPTDYPSYDDLDWWPKQMPSGAKIGQNGKGTYIVVLPRGDTAIVWLAMFNT